MQARAALIDIEGVLIAGGRAIDGSIDALARLRAAGVGIRFVTNTTRKVRADVVRDLRALGFALDPREVLTCALAARRMLLDRGLRPHLLVHPGLRPEFDGIPTDHPNAVVVGDAGEGFSYGALNAAFRVLIDPPGATLIALATNRYYRAADGLALDAGPFVAALEYGAGLRATVTGKPAEPLFRDALDELGVPAPDAVMIGDDAEMDIGGAARLGLRTVLVRTGKYRPGDEDRVDSRPDQVRSASRPGGRSGHGTRR